MSAPASKRHAATREAAAGEETTRTVSSPEPPSARPSEEVPAGEPEAPVGPTSPSEDGDESGQSRAEPETGGSDPEPSDDHEHNLERDLEELSAKAQMADEYLELAQRTKADFENYRRRASREVAAAQDRGAAKLAKELLPAVDNLDRALGAVNASEGEGHDGQLVSGLRLVHDEVIAALGRVGIEAYSPEGEPFDPGRHEAVAQQPIEGAPAGSVVEVYQPGYRLGDTILRPARVLVAG